VSGSSGEGSAVLLRGIEPISGIETMKERRNTKIISKLCNGPGKIAKAFAMNKQDNYKELGNSEFLITDGIDIRDNDIVTTTRIGINLSKELPLRFYLKGNSSVSRL
jgi:DNA-3-methyladenine glycosylase